MYTSWLALGISLLSGTLAFPVERSSTLHCSTIPLNHAQYLYFSFSKDPPEDAMSTVAISPNYTLSNALHALGSHASPGNNPMVLISSPSLPGYHFGFEACTSTYMNLPSFVGSGGVRWYGHIRAYTSHDGVEPALCVTRRWVEPGHEFLTAEACSYADNSSQETQFFVVLEEYKIGKYSLGVIGGPAGKASKQYYFKPGNPKAPAVTVKPDQDTEYRLGIEYLPE